MTANCPICNRKMPKERELAFGELSFVWATGRVEFRGKSCKLAAAHLSLLEALIDAGPRGMSRMALEDELWGSRGEAPSPKLLDVMMSQMRSKFRQTGLEIDIVTNGGRYERRNVALVLGQTPKLRVWPANTKKLALAPPVSLLAAE